MASHSSHLLRIGPCLRSTRATTTRYQRQTKRGYASNTYVHGQPKSLMAVHPDGIERPRMTAAFKRMQLEEWRRINAERNAVAASAGFAQPWSHKMSLIVTRPMILQPLPEEWEVQYNEWRTRYDAPIVAQIPSIQPLLDDDPAKKNADLVDSKGLSEAELAEMDEEQRARALRAEEIARAAREELEIKVGTRITKADLENDRRSLRRKLDDKLYFIVKKNRENHTWQFPQIPMPLDMTNETKKLRDFAADGVTHSAGANIHCYMTGNAPVGFYTYSYPKETQKSLDTYGAKLFFYRGYYVKGTVKTPSRYVDHAWVTKTELQEYLQDPELYKYLDGILI